MFITICKLRFLTHKRKYRFLFQLNFEHIKCWNSHSLRVWKIYKKGYFCWSLLCSGLVNWSKFSSYPFIRPIWGIVKLWRIVLCSVKQSSDTSLLFQRHNEDVDGVVWVLWRLGSWDSWHLIILLRLRMRYKQKAFKQKDPNL